MRNKTVPLKTNIEQYIMRGNGVVTLGHIHLLRELRKA